jgi:hypothetical protein
MLEECITEEKCSVVRFLWAKGLNAKDIHKEIFPVYGGKCLSRKAVHNWVETFCKGLSKVEDDAAGFDGLVKRLDKCINVDGGYVEK